MTGILALQGILGSSARPDRRLAGATQHLVDLVPVHLLLGDHVPCVLLQQHAFAFHQAQQLVIGRLGQVFMLQALVQDVADIVLFGLQQGALCPGRDGRQAG